MTSEDNDINDSETDSNGNFLNELLQVSLIAAISKIRQQEDDSTPYSLSIEDKASNKTIYIDISKEEVLQITYVPLSINRVFPITRCTASLEGHTDAILTLSFSPNSELLASGSGDTTIRLWDLKTQTPYHVLKEHSNWVFALSWSSCSKMLASGSQAVTCLAWESSEHTKHPRLASASLDLKVHIWDSKNGHCLQTIFSNTLPITALKFSSGLYKNDPILYFCGRDSFLEVYNAKTGVRLKRIKAHGHWINTLSINTEWASKNCIYDELNSNKAVQCEDELLLTGSDDCTLCLWAPFKSSTPIATLTGHQKPVIFAEFSPNRKLIASASFDNSIRIWDGKTGAFIGVLRGHVGPVYRLAWSPDSKFIVSASADSTVKEWNVEKKCIQEDLPGHADEVFAIDWSLDGSKVASGSKDRLVKFWCH